MTEGKYGVWRSGSECNDDVENAPASCLELGRYELADDAKITFTNGATGESKTTAYVVKTVGLGSKSSASVQTTGAQDKSGTSDNQKPVATGMMLNSCVDSPSSCSLTSAAAGATAAANNSNAASDKVQSRINGAVNAASGDPTQVNSPKK
jgi:hypothetical protein